MLMYALADRLGKTVGELVNTMSAAEREGWLAYLKHEADFRRAAQR
jgi:DNA-binding MarR family transcriptional regulator